ncbi:sigma-70 region 4 domain-containing protein [Paenarthrobacter sp. Z7-10]|uniref:RNA polymerase sigma factor n=1 Tax=Paenarthrobacter sp. Z7-10 TaxID=2787635 RepID=UPI0022A92287|nr:sigma-70 region 4 domain-containing protein [Paenarthrobacter sp. Z7-10]MCZ2403512.1 sigma-70 region 4 domain-containing protein [Paenarthrobacter sp. Z7-10]
MRAEPVGEMATPVDFAGLHQASFHKVNGYFSRRLAPGAPPEDATKTVFRAAFADWFQDGTAEVNDLLLLRHSHLLWKEELEPGAHHADILPFPGGTDQDRRWRGLSPGDRELLVLAYWDGLSCQEIAEVTGSASRRINRRLRAATTTLAAALGLDPAAMSRLDPLHREHRAEEALCLRVLRRISDEGLLISDSESDSDGGSVSDGDSVSVSGGAGVQARFRKPSTRTGRPGSRRRRSSRPAVAGLVLVAAAATALVAGVSLNSPPPTTPPQPTVRLSGGSPPSFTEPTTSRTYGPFEHWSRFEALNTSVSFELAPTWTVNSVSTTRGNRSTLYAQVMDRNGAVKGVLNLGSRADVPSTCSLDPKEQGRSVSLDSIPVPGLNPARPGNVPTFRYQVLDGTPVRSTLGISDGSFALHSAGCTEPDIVQQQGAGGLLYVAFGGQEELPYPGRASSGGGSPAGLFFHNMAQARAYQATTDYANTKRMMTSLRIKSVPTPVRTIVMNPSTGKPACEISNVRGPNNDTTYEDHPDYFVVLGCADEWMAFRATYQSAPARPKLIYFAKQDGVGYMYDPELPSAQVLGWAELMDRTAAAGQTSGQWMDRNFEAAGIPVALREKLVGNGP